MYNSEESNLKGMKMPIKYFYQAVVLFDLLSTFNLYTYLNKFYLGKEKANKAVNKKGDKAENKSMPPNKNLNNFMKMPIRKQTTKDSKFLDMIKKNRINKGDNLYLPNKLSIFLKASKSNEQDSSTLTIDDRTIKLPEPKSKSSIDRYSVVDSKEKFLNLLK